MNQYDVVKVKSRKTHGVVMIPSNGHSLNNVKLKDGTTAMLATSDLEVQNGRTNKLAKEIKKLFD